MANLIPEQRLDRNGKLVTKHVRATPQQATQRSAMPAPSVSSQEKNEAGRKPFKPRKAQLEQEYHAHRMSRFFPDKRLLTDAELKSWNTYNLHYSFTASEVEIYDVLSVADAGSAFQMLSRDVRTAEDAKEYLTKEGAPDLIIDRRETMREAVEKNVSHYDFVNGYESLPPSLRTSEHLIDTVRFIATSLNHGNNSQALKEINAGNISFEDIKAVGITKLKPHDRLYSLLTVFRKLHRGEGDYTVDGIKELLRRSSEDNIQNTEFNYVCRVMDQIGLEEVLKFKNLSNLAKSFHTYRIAPGASKFNSDGIDRAVYAARFTEGLNNPRVHIYISDPFFEAGIPLETAIDVAAKGGGVREAQAIHEEGIEGGLSGGWL